MAAILYSSDELIEDSDLIDVVDLIVQLFSEALMREEDRVLTVGNGTTQPTGLTTARAATTIATITSATGNLSFDDMINLEYSLPQKYQANAKYIINRLNIRELRKLKDDNGRYFWQEPVAAGQPATFHGFPVIENNNLPKSEIFFGDFKMGYWLGDRMQMSVKITQDTETALNSKGSIKRVNCWETLMKNIKTISSQVYTAMCLKVQSIVDDTLMVSNSTTSALSSLTI